MNAFRIIVAVLVAAATGRALFSSAGRRPAAVSRSTPVPSRVWQASDAPRRLKPFPLLAYSDPFDGAGALIWRTQIPALRTVCENEPRGIACAELKPIYVEVARRYPEIYEGHNFQQWGQLLLDLGLFRVAAQSVHITPAGRALLDLLLSATQQHSREIAPQWVTRLKNA